MATVHQTVLKIAIRDRSTSGHSAESDIGGISTELFTEENSIHTLLPKDELTSTEKQKDSNLHEKNSKLKNRRPTGWILSTRQNATKKHDENENIKKKSTIQTYAVKVAEADDNINVKEESGKLLECYEVDMIYGTALHDCTDAQPIENAEKRLQMYIPEIERTKQVCVYILSIV